jgi:hypothetical protein
MENNNDEMCWCQLAVTLKNIIKIDTYLECC